MLFQVYYGARAGLGLSPCHQVLGDSFVTPSGLIWGHCTPTESMHHHQGAVLLIKGNSDLCIMNILC